MRKNEYFFSIIVNLINVFKKILFVFGIRNLFWVCYYDFNKNSNYIDNVF